jgi:hypothetical protein
VFVAGTIAATESTADSATITGDVFVAGSLIAAESGSDTLAATGTVLVAGSLSATEVSPDTAEASGSVLVAGDLAAEETGEDTFAATSQTASTPERTRPPFGIAGELYDQKKSRRPAVKTNDERIREILAKQESEFLERLIADDEDLLALIASSIANAVAGVETWRT